MRGGDRPSRGFLAAVLALLAVLVAAALFVASREWFSRDDFAFLVHVQREGWSWRDVFLPLDERFWTFYRPLGMETYFRLGHAVFGVEAFGYFATSLAFHFAGAGLVVGIARQLGFGAHAAWAAALLAVSRPSGLTEIHYGSVFHFVLSGTLTLCAVGAYLAHQAGRGPVWRAASLLALALALLTNEVNALIPVLCVLAAWARAGWTARAWVAAWPHALGVAAYLVFRFGLLPSGPLTPLHTPGLGPHVLHNAGVEALAAVGGPLCAAALAALGAAAWRWGDTAGLGRRSLALLGWCAAALAPFALLPYPQARYAMPAEAPFALLAGAWLDALWRAASREREPSAASLRHAASRRRLREVWLVVALALAVPWSALAERAARPLGEWPRRLAAAVAAERLTGKRRVVVLYGGPGLAAGAEAIRFRYLAYNGTVVHAVYPESEITLRFHDVADRPPRSVIRPGSVYLTLSSALEVEAADGALLDRLLPRGLERERP